MDYLYLSVPVAESAGSAEHWIEAKIWDFGMHLRLTILSVIRLSYGFND